MALFIDVYMCHQASDMLNNVAITIWQQMINT